MAAVQIPQTPALPAAGTWALDTTHTDVSFTARHLMVTKVRGRFAVSGGTVTIAENPLDSSVEATIDVASVNSGEAGARRAPALGRLLRRRELPHHHLPFDQGRRRGRRRVQAHGELTIKDVTRPVDARPRVPRHRRLALRRHPRRLQRRAPRSAARTGASTGTWRSKPAASSSATRSSSTSTRRRFSRSNARAVTLSSEQPRRRPRSCPDRRASTRSLHVAFAA